MLQSFLHAQAKTCHPSRFDRFEPPRIVEVGRATLSSLRLAAGRFMSYEESMPVHLASLSRRAFLGRVVLGASALALTPKLSSGAVSSDPHSWALLADTHISGKRNFVARTVHLAEHLAQTIKDIVSLEGRPSGAIINGDCAYGSGQTADYEVLVDLLRPLRAAGVPVHLALGNHDHRGRFLEAVPLENPGARRPLVDKHVALVRAERANWFILDSLEVTEQTPGLLGGEQLAWLAGTLDANREKPAIVVAHHNPGISGNTGLKDTVAMFEIIRPRKQVKAFIYGHTHSWKLEQDTTGLHLINLPPVAYIFREGDPSGWVHARLERNGMRLKFHAIDASHKCHGQESVLPWRKA